MSLVDFSASLVNFRVLSGAFRTHILSLSKRSLPWLYWRRVADADLVRSKR